MSVKAIDYDALATTVRQEVIPVWQAESVMGLFPWVPIPNGIAASDWASKYLLQTQGANWTAAGYDPNFVTISYQGYKLAVDTVAQAMQLEEQDLAFYQVHGFFDKSVKQLAENAAKTSNLAFFYGLDAAGATPHSTQYNYVLDESTASGTGARPLMAVNSATAGTWKTFANIDKDIANLLGGMESMGYPKSECIVVYPRVADPAMMLHFSEYQDRSIKEHFDTQCRGAIAVPNDYLPTNARATAPTLADFDIFAIHIPSVVIGYTRAERLRIVPPFGTVRTTTIEFEVWYCPLFVPKPLITTTGTATTTKYYKGIGMLDGCLYT